MKFNRLAEKLSDKFIGKSTLKASRKGRDIVSKSMSIVIIIAAAGVFFLQRLKFESLFNDLNYNENTSSSIDLFKESFYDKFALYFILITSIIIIIYIASVYLLTEAFLLFNKYAKKYIFKKRLDDYEKIDKKTVKPVFISTFIFICVFLVIFLKKISSFFSYILSGNSEQNYSEIEYLLSDILPPVLFLMFLAISSSILIQNYYFIKSKVHKKKKLQKLVINYNLISTIFYSFLMVIILNIWSPLVIKGLNYSIDLSHNAFTETINIFANHVSKNNLDVGVSGFDKIAHEVSRIEELKLDVGNFVIEISPLFLYFIVIVFAIIIIMPKLYVVGWKQSIIMIVALILGSIISEFFVTLLYVNENTKNSILIYILVYFVLTFAINEISDLFKDKMNSNIKN